MESSWTRGLLVDGPGPGGPEGRGPKVDCSWTLSWTARGAGDPTVLEETSLRKQPFKGPIKKLFPLRKQPFKGRVELHLFPQSLKGSVYMFPRNIKPEAVKQDYYNVQEEQC